MIAPARPAIERIRRLLARVGSSHIFWGLVGWALLFLRYASDVIHPRYGG